MARAYNKTGKLRKSSKPEKTPKIIHFLWLNFNKKSNGKLDESLTFFKNRIEALHPKDKGWKINFISSWKECLKSISGVKWLNDLLNNEHVGAAHKSDALRYFYLYKMGGVWIDLSTFLVKPLDDLVKQNNEGFTCYYTSSNLCASWIIKLTSEIYDQIGMEGYIKKVIPIQKSLINIKDKNFNFITENYFIISSKKNEICKNVVQQLKSFWTVVLPKINSKEDYCYELTNLIFDLSKKIYNINIPYLNLTKQLPKTKRVILKKYFDCGYLFNYLQLYLAIRNYSIKNSGVLKNVPNSPEKRKIIKSRKLSSFSKQLCYSYSCHNKIIKFKHNPNKNIRLLSASYNRLSKWSNDISKRISWDTTLAGDILKSKNPYTVLKNLQRVEIYQLKYGSWTRNSPTVTRLKELFGNKLTLTPDDSVNNNNNTKKYRKKRKSNKTKRRRRKKR
tara:strand:+ start:11024 stop:12364 length:1341 start_codon:yes stop_codon:yes gene_type:complete